MGQVLICGVGIYVLLEAYTGGGNPQPESYTRSKAVFISIAVTVYYV